MTDANNGELETTSPSIQSSPEKKRRPKMVVVKYFDESDKYAKIIPRTAAHILARRKVSPTNDEDAAKTSKVTGRDLIGLIERDQTEWMMKYNPIEAVMLYNERQNKFNQVQDAQEFPIPKAENVFTFHVKRKIPVERILGQSTMTFSVSAAAESWLESAYVKMFDHDNAYLYQIRYYDIYHHGYTRMFRGDRIPIGRTGNSMVKILLEKVQQEAIVQQEQFLKMKSPISSIDDEYDDDQDVAEYEDDDREQDELVCTDDSFVVLDDRDTKNYFFEEDGNFEIIESAREEIPKELEEFSKFVVLSKIPKWEVPKNVNEHNAFEKEKIIAWKNMDIPRVVDKNMKALIRRGIPGLLRKKVWMTLTGSLQLLEQYPLFYDTAFRKLYGSYSGSVNEINPRSYSDFGGALPEDGILNADGIKAAKRLLNVMSDCHSDVEFCPSLPQMTYTLLSLMNEKETYATLHCMVEASRRNKKYLRINKMQYVLFVETFSDIIKKKVPNLALHFDKIGFDLSELTSIWFKTLFYKHLPFKFCIRIIDIYMSEGNRVLYRVAYAILKTLEAKILDCKSSSYMIDFITERCAELRDEKDFFKKAFSLGLRKQQLEELDEKNRSVISPMKLSTPLNKFSKPKIASNSEIVKDMSHWELLFTWLPYAMRVRTLELIFTTSRDGYALSQLYKKSEDAGACVLLILAVPKSDGNGLQNDAQEQPLHESDSNTIIDMIKVHQMQGKSLRKELKKIEENKPSGSSSSITSPKGKSKKNKVKDPFIIGAYSGEPPAKTFHFSGTTDTFLFSMYPIEARYKWSRKNDYFVMGRNDRLVYGGGGDGPGLVMDEMMSDGSSNRSITFENEPLCGAAIGFNILKVEMFAFK